MLSTFNKRLDAVSRSRAVVPDSWNMALVVRAMRICISMLRKYWGFYPQIFTDFVPAAQIRLKFRRLRSSVRIC